MSSFSTQAADIGQGIGSFLNPIIGGTTKTTVTEVPTNTTDSKKTITIVIVLVVVVVVGYFILKPKKAA